MKRSTVPLVIFSILLSACSLTGSSGSTQESSSAQPSSESVMETPNVSYEGVLSPLDISAYQQGTHRLELGDGRMLLLESQVVDFSPSVGHRVEVYGALRPTIEEGGIIMRVERLTDFAPSSASSKASSSSLALRSSQTSSSEAPVAPASSTVAMSSKPSLVPTSTAPLAPTPSSSAAPVIVLPSSSTLSVASSKAAVSSSASVSQAATGNESKIVTVSKADLSASKWTQSYCTEHIGFCVPIHKNWWYVSFGAMAESLWHVEAGPEDFSELGQGVISVDLVGGSLSSIGAQDNAVVVSGSKAIGYRDWTQGRHIEISGDARLIEAIRYMTQHLSGTVSR